MFNLLLYYEDLFPTISNDVICQFCNMLNTHIHFGTRKTTPFSEKKELFS